ncbi:MAG: hypothetical protein U0746_13010 [Gemmataceae bacterium]
MSRFLAGLSLLGLTAALPAADEPSAAPAPTGPVATIALCSRQAQAAPTRVGFTHTGAGNIDVQQPTPDVLLVTMTGVAVAGGHPCKDSVAALAFDLSQEFEVAFTKEKVKNPKVSIEARVIGLLRSHAKGGGSASITCPAHAVVVPCGGGPALVEVDLQGRSVACGDNLSVNDKQGPVSAALIPGKYTLKQVFGVQAAHPQKLLPCKAASAEFAPDPALDPLWISAFEPFHGAAKKDFGFQVTVKVSAE